MRTQHSSFTATVAYLHVDAHFLRAQDSVLYDTFKLKKWSKQAASPHSIPTPRQLSLLNTERVLLALSTFYKVLVTVATI